MPTTILATKLFAPPRRPKAVPRPRLIQRLDEGLSRKLTLICAPAGFGKTTLVSEWIAACACPSAWLSLDERDGDPAHFLAYLIAALQTISAGVGAGVSGLLQSSSPPPPESILPVLLNEISAIPGDFVLVLDDYHLVSAKPVDDAVAFLLDHLPSQMHLVVATREDPQLSLARLRARGQLAELRPTDLRFTQDEAAGFFNKAMNLGLSEAGIAALETRTEGWIAGLQLAALSLQGNKDVTGFIQSFTGSNRFVQDYLMEEVLRRQSDAVQTFLLRTSILDRLCGSLCDAVLQGHDGQQTLEYLEQANLFIVPLDNERRWYRYHHLFADLLRQRLRQSESSSPYHLRASEWYESHDMRVEAFSQAVAAQNIDRILLMLEGDGMPLHFRGVTTPIIQWIQSQSRGVLDAHPSLCVTLAWALMMSGKPSQVEPQLKVAEAILRDLPQSTVPRDLSGQIAALRALVAAAFGQTESIVPLATLALELLSPTNQSVRTATNCTLGFAYRYLGDRTSAQRVLSEVASTGRASGNLMFGVAASVSLGQIQESENQLLLAADTYRKALEMVDDPTHLVGCEIHLGLANLYYEWNDLDLASTHADKASTLAGQLECDIGLAAEALKIRLLLAQNKVTEAERSLAKASEVARANKFNHRISELAALQVTAKLRSGQWEAEAGLAETHHLFLSQVRVLLAKSEFVTANTLVESWLRQNSDKTTPREILHARLLQALALDGCGRLDSALQILQDLFALTESMGHVRLFVDEGRPMESLLTKASTRGFLPHYLPRLINAFGAFSTASQPLVEPLSERELDVLRLMILGHSNQEIGEQLFLSLSTVKWHNQNIFGKLQVQRRTEAIARARELNLIS